MGLSHKCSVFYCLRIWWDVYFPSYEAHSDNNKILKGDQHMNEKCFGKNYSGTCTEKNPSVYGGVSSEGSVLPPSLVRDVFSEADPPSTRVWWSLPNTSLWHFLTKPQRPLIIQLAKCSEQKSTQAAPIYKTTPLQGGGGMHLTNL